jgi:HEAT repeat protein
MSALAQGEDPRGVPIAKKLLGIETDEDVKQAAEEYIARAAPPGSLTEEQLAKLRNSLGSPDAVIRKRALDEARAHLTHPEVRALVQVLGQLDADKEVQKIARGILEEDLADLVDQSESAVDAVPPDLSPEQLLERTEKVQAKFRNLLSRRQEVMRMKAVLKAKKYKEKSLLPVILERLEAESSPVVLATILATLADLGSDEHVPLIAPYLSHGNYRVVNGAVLALHRLGGDEVLPLFLPLLTRDDPRVQSQALVAVMRLNAEQLLGYVRQMAASPREGVRASAITCLHRIPLPEVEEIAREMLEREGEQKQIDRLVALLTDRASQRSAGPLWALKNKRPELERSIHSILERVIERSGMSHDDIRIQGSDWEKSQAEIQLQREREAAAKAAQRRTTRKEIIYQPPPPSTPPWLWVGGLIGVALLFFNFEWGDSGMGTGGGVDGISRLQETVVQQSQPKPVVIDQSVPATADGVAAEVAGQVDEVRRFTKDETIMLARDRLVKGGYANSEYVEMEARGEWRELYAKSYDQAHDLLKDNDIEGAIRVIEEALGATEPENLLVRRDLMSELQALYIKAGKRDKALDILKKNHELAMKIVAIKRATKNPYAAGETMATEEELAAMKAAGAQLEGALDAALTIAKQPKPGRPDPEDMRKRTRDALAEMKARGEVSEADIQKSMKELEDELEEQKKEREQEAQQPEEGQP